ncbi:MAG: hypothetical protein GC181_15310 [Bacteroidetes bacterium]|nr:hypothetical protein [Bacteroidota bacterium]
MFRGRSLQYYLGALSIISLFLYSPSASAQEDENKYVSECDTNGRSVLCAFKDSTGYVWEIHKFKGGDKSGKWQYFNRKGEVIEERFYRRNKLIWTYYYRDGQVIRSINKKGKIKNFKGCGC